MHIMLDVLCISSLCIGQHTLSNNILLVTIVCQVCSQTGISGLAESGMSILKERKKQKFAKKEVNTNPKNGCYPARYSMCSLCFTYLGFQSVS